MSGPNGDPNISPDDSIINDEDDFGEEGKTTKAFIVSDVSNH